MLHDLSTTLLSIFLVYNSNTYLCYGKTTMSTCACHIHIPMYHKLYHSCTIFTVNFAKNYKKLKYAILTFETLDDATIPALFANLQVLLLKTICQIVGI